jgi:hypothetical protein
MKILSQIIIIASLSVAILKAQSSVNINGNSAIELLENNTICVDTITVQNGSSFTAYDYTQVKKGDCTTLLTPGGGGDITLPVEIDNTESLPTQFIIEPAFPNPFNPSTTIRYGIPYHSEVSISIYDLMGRLVITLFEGEQMGGWYEITWDGLFDDRKIAAAGMYFYKITAGNEVKTSKITLVK